MSANDVVLVLLTVLVASDDGGVDLARVGRVARLDVVESPGGSVNPIACVAAAPRMGSKAAAHYPFISIAAVGH